MNGRNKARTQIDIDLSVWADLKRFATLQGLSTSNAVQSLLTKALNIYGSETQKGMPSAGSSFQHTNQRTSLQEVK